MVLAGLLMVAPSLGSDIAGLVVAAPVVFMQMRSSRDDPSPSDASSD
jgi:hypothetical protein